MTKEILLLVDALSREKNVPRDIVFLALEMALASATKKRFKDEVDVRVGQQRTQQSGDVGGGEGSKIGVDEHNKVRIGGGQGPPHRLALATKAGQPREDTVERDHSGPMCLGDRRGVVGRPGVEHHQVVHQRSEQLVVDRLHDLTHRGGLVEGREHHGNGLVLAREQVLQLPVVGSGCALVQPGLNVLGHVPPRGRSVPTSVSQFP